VELRHLRYFVAVADELNFTRAATRLNTSQPSLSQQIRHLEVEVGVALLERSRHHVSLTDAGRAFLRETKDILGRIEHAGRLAKQAAAGRAGDLSVGEPFRPPTSESFRHYAHLSPPTCLTSASSCTASTPSSP
jgi:LysR family hca operon transcriptional activator